jgi:aspartokinase-like uncharacterized kinase
LLDSDLISHQYQYLSIPRNLASNWKAQALASRPYIVMAEAPGVTEADLKAKIIEQLQATHVEIEDMSGIVYFYAADCPALLVNRAEC